MHRLFYVRLDKTMYPMCVRAANALVRLHLPRLVSVVDVRITDPFVLFSWHVLQIVFVVWWPKKKLFRA